MKKETEKLIDLFSKEIEQSRCTRKQIKAKVLILLKSINSIHKKNNTCNYSHKNLDFLDCPKYKKYKRGCHSCKCYDIKTMS